MPAKDKVEFIMVHCSATRPNWMAGLHLAAKVAEIRRWHIQERKWRDIAYAKIIDRDGQVAPGRDLDGDGDVWEETGAGAKGWNHNCIHLCLLGGHGSDADDKFAEHFTPAQDRALRKEIAAIRLWAGRQIPVKGHNEVAVKACPGFNVRDWYASSEPLPVAPAPTPAKRNWLVDLLKAIFGGKA